MRNEGFFTADGDVLVPAAFASSPWGPVLHGRLIGGLTARAAGSAIAADPGLACARLTVDMFRSAKLAPLTTSVRPVRTGRRIALLEVTVAQADGPVGSGLALLLREAPNPASTPRPAPEWDAPRPPDLGPPRSTAPGGRWTAPWEVWRVTAGSGLSGGLWMRDVHPLVTGEPLTPLERVAMAADMVSPVSNSTRDGLSFINADYTLYLGRRPEGEYAGIQPAGHVSDQGVAAGQCVLHDERGPVGFVSTAAVANPRIG